MTTAQYIMENYGKSLNQIRLDVAAAYFVAHAPNVTPSQAWAAADEFSDELERTVKPAAQELSGTLERLR